MAAVVMEATVVMSTSEFSDRRSEDIGKLDYGDAWQITSETIFRRCLAMERCQNEASWDGSLVQMSSVQ